LHCAAQPAPGAAKNPVKTQEVTRFFELLKAGRAASRNYNVNDVPNWDSKAIVGFVTTGGLTVEDVNAKGAKRYSPDQVEAALTKRAGEVFQSFSHISFLYAKGKKQYSEVRFTEKPGCVVATLATWYELEFITDGGRLKLLKCKYINQDGD
jgi:hypothetical protein